MSETTPETTLESLAAGPQQTPIEGLREMPLHEIGARVTTERVELRDGLKASAAALGAAYHDTLSWVRACARAGIYRLEGHRNEVTYVSAELGVSNWEARRMIAAATALEGLPRISGALRSGELSPPKVLELTRFATPAREARLITWARKASPRDIRLRAERELARDEAEVTSERESYCRLGWEWGLDRECVSLWGTLPPEQGAALIAAVDARAEQIARPPEGEDGPRTLSPIFGNLDDPNLEVRRAAALLELVTASGDEAPRPTVVLHAPLESLRSGRCNAVLEGGTVVLDPKTAQELSCDARIQVVVEDEDGSAVGIGRSSQKIPRWLRRQVLYRDGHVCCFPGCERRNFLKAHHIRHWTRDGRTELDNLITVCFFHHDLIHRYGWSVILASDRRIPIWFRPGGRRYEPGPAPPEDPSPEDDPQEERRVLAQAAGFSHLFELTRLF